MSAKDIAALTSLLARMKTNGGKKKKRGARPAKSAAGQPTPGTSGVVTTVRGGARRRRRPAAGVSDGSVTLTRKELCVTVTTASSPPSLAELIPLVPSGTVLPWLYNITKVFERLVWRSVRVEYVPMVGTTEGGSVIYGVDWAYAVDTATKATRANVSTLTPVCDGPIWQRSAISLPASELQTRRFYSLVSTDKFDNSPGQLCVNATSKTAATVGEIWVTYTVSLSGTRPA